MEFNPWALLILVGILVLFAMALSSQAGPWFYLAEAIAAVIIIAGLREAFRKGRR